MKKTHLRISYIILNFLLYPSLNSEKEVKMPVLMEIAF